MWRIVAFVCVFLLLLAGGTAFFGYKYAENYYMDPGPLSEDKVVLIEKGSSIKRIARVLAEHDVIEHPELFSWILRLYKEGIALQAGEYNFAKQSSPQEIVDRLERGDTVVYSLTIPEGLMAFQVMELVSNAPALQGAVSGAIGEGELLPETYHYHRNDTRDSLVARMRASMQEAVDKAWESRQQGLPIKTKEELVILASIVEKETGEMEERGQVAAVFVNRLRKPMRLQSDPTTIYGITQGKFVLERPLSKRDLATKTPYNTYTEDRMPPTPIANPGKAAIEAVANPPQSNKLYFVADGSGGHVFSSTLKEHNKHVRHLRKLERSRKKQRQ